VQRRGHPSRASAARARAQRRRLVGQAHLLQRHLTAEQLGTRPASIVRDPGLHDILPLIFPAESLTARRSTSKHELLIRRLLGLIVGSAYPTCPAPCDALSAAVDGLASAGDWLSCPDEAWLPRPEADWAITRLFTEQLPAEDS
jgi:hypothetical protein